MNEILTDQQEHLVNTTIQSIGGDVWGKFQEASQVGITTAKLCFDTFESLKTGFDYAAVITPIMKALEVELKKRFYDEYLRYLIQHYEPNDYAHATEQSKNELICRKILEVKDGRLVYISDTSVFTLGDFRFIIGASRLSKIRIHQPFIQYCQDVLFDDAVEKQKIIAWLTDLVHSIHSLRSLRNESAHGGKTQNRMDAQTALDELIDVKKILVKIVHPEF